jgi:hypothetical protein
VNYAHIISGSGANREALGMVDKRGPLRKNIRKAFWVNNESSTHNMNIQTQIKPLFKQKYVIIDEDEYKLPTIANYSQTFREGVICD